jgi:hypothetical protein
MQGAAGQSKPDGNPAAAPPALNKNITQKEGENAGDNMKDGMGVDHEITIPSRIQRTFKFLDTKFACSNQRDRNV